MPGLKGQAVLAKLWLEGGRGSFSQSRARGHARPSPALNSSHVLLHTLKSSLLRLDVVV